jgi:hypothetical protein
MYPDHGNIEQLQMPNRTGNSGNNDNEEEQTPTNSGEGNSLPLYGSTALMVAILTTETSL